MSILASLIKPLNVYTGWHNEIAPFFKNNIAPTNNDQSAQALDMVCKIVQILTFIL